VTSSATRKAAFSLSLKKGLSSQAERAKILPEPSALVDVADNPGGDGVVIFLGIAEPE